MPIKNLVAAVERGRSLEREDTKTTPEAGTLSPSNLTSIAQTNASTTTPYKLHPSYDESGNTTAGAVSAGAVGGSSLMSRLLMRPNGTTSSTATASSANVGGMPMTLTASLVTSSGPHQNQQHYSANGVPTASRSPALTASDAGSTTPHMHLTSIGGVGGAPSAVFLVSRADNDSSYLVGGGGGGGGGAGSSSSISTTATTTTTTTTTTTGGGAVSSLMMSSSAVGGGRSYGGGGGGGSSSATTFHGGGLAGANGSTSNSRDFSGSHSNSHHNHQQQASHHHHHQHLHNHHIPNSARNTSHGDSSSSTAIINAHVPASSVAGSGGGMPMATTIINGTAAYPDDGTPLTHLYNDSGSIQPNGRQQRQQSSTSADETINAKHRASTGSSVAAGGIIMAGSISNGGTANSGNGGGPSGGTILSNVSSFDNGAGVGVGGVGGGSGGGHQLSNNNASPHIATSYSDSQNRPSPPISPLRGRGGMENASHPPTITTTEDGDLSGGFPTHRGGSPPSGYPMTGTSQSLIPMVPASGMATSESAASGGGGGIGMLASSTNPPPYAGLGSASTNAPYMSSVTTHAAGIRSTTGGNIVVAASSGVFGGQASKSPSPSSPYLYHPAYHTRNGNGGAAPSPQQLDSHSNNDVVAATAAGTDRHRNFSTTSTAVPTTTYHPPAPLFNPAQMMLAQQQQRAVAAPGFGGSGSSPANGSLNANNSGYSGGGAGGGNHTPNGLAFVAAEVNFSGMFPTNGHHHHFSSSGGMDQSSSTNNNNNHQQNNQHHTAANVRRGNSAMLSAANSVNMPVGGWNGGVVGVFAVGGGGSSTTHSHHGVVAGKLPSNNFSTHTIGAGTNDADASTAATTSAMTTTSAGGSTPVINVGSVTTTIEAPYAPSAGAVGSSATKAPRRRSVEINEGAVGGGGETGSSGSTNVHRAGTGGAFGSDVASMQSSMNAQSPLVSCGASPSTNGIIANVLGGSGHHHHHHVNLGGVHHPHHQHGFANHTNNSTTEPSGGGYSAAAYAPIASNPTSPQQMMLMGGGGGGNSHRTSAAHLHSGGSPHHPYSLPSASGTSGGVDSVNVSAPTSGGGSGGGAGVYGSTQNSLGEASGGSRSNSNSLSNNPTHQSSPSGGSGSALHRSGGGGGGASGNASPHQQGGLNGSISIGRGARGGSTTPQSPALGSLPSQYMASAGTTNPTTPTTTHGPPGAAGWTSSNVRQQHSNAFNGSHNNAAGGGPSYGGGGGNQSVSMVGGDVGGAALYHQNSFSNIGKWMTGFVTNPADLRRPSADVSQFAHNQQQSGREGSTRRGLNNERGGLASGGQFNSMSNLLQGGNPNNTSMYGNMTYSQSHQSLQVPGLAPNNHTQQQLQQAATQRGNVNDFLTHYTKLKKQYFKSSGASSVGAHALAQYESLAEQRCRDFGRQLMTLVENFTIKATEDDDSTMQMYRFDSFRQPKSQSPRQHDIYPPSASARQSMSPSTELDAGPARTTVVGGEDHHHPSNGNGNSTRPSNIMGNNQAANATASVSRVAFINNDTPSTPAILKPSRDTSQPLSSASAGFHPITGGTMSMSQQQYSTTRNVGFLSEDNLQNATGNFKSQRAVKRGGARPGSADTTISTASALIKRVDETHSVKRSTDDLGFATINQYVVVQHIGKGMQGKVKLVSNEEGAMFAMKVVPKAMIRRAMLKQLQQAEEEEEGSPTSSPKKEIVSGIDHEIAVMKKVRHRNVIALFEVIDDPGSKYLYLIMQYAEKGPVVKIDPKALTCKPLSPQVAAKYLRQLISGLRYLHRKKIIHRDIKPDNMLVTQDDTICIADFGVSEILEDDAKSIRGVLGTRVFFPPELMKDCGATEMQGPAVDVWALGVSAFFMVFGRSPFNSDSGDITKQVVECNVQYPSYVLDAVEAAAAKKAADCSNNSSSSTTAYKKNFAVPAINLSNVSASTNEPAPANDDTPIPVDWCQWKDVFDRIFTADPNDRISLRDLKDMPLLAGLDMNGNPKVATPQLVPLNAGAPPSGTTPRGFNNNASFSRMGSIRITPRGKNDGSGVSFVNPDGHGNSNVSTNSAPFAPSSVPHESFNPFAHNGSRRTSRVGLVGIDGVVGAGGTTAAHFMLQNAGPTSSDVLPDQVLANRPPPMRKATIAIGHDSHAGNGVQAPDVNGGGDSTNYNDGAATPIGPSATVAFTPEAAAALATRFATANNNNNSGSGAENNNIVGGSGGGLHQPIVLAGIAGGIGQTMSTSINNNYSALGPYAAIANMSFNNNVSMTDLDAMSASKHFEAFLDNNNGGSTRRNSGGGNNNQSMMSAYGGSGLNRNSAMTPQYDDYEEEDDDKEDFGETIVVTKEDVRSAVRRVKSFMQDDDIHSPVAGSPKEDGVRQSQHRQRSTTVAGQGTTTSSSDDGVQTSSSNGGLSVQLASDTTQAYFAPPPRPGSRLNANGGGNGSAQIPPVDPSSPTARKLAPSPAPPTSRQPLSMRPPSPSLKEALGSGGGSNASFNRAASPNGPTPPLGPSGGGRASIANNTAAASSTIPQLANDDEDESASLLPTATAAGGDRGGGGGGGGAGLTITAPSQLHHRPHSPQGAPPSQNRSPSSLTAGGRFQVTYVTTANTTAVNSPLTSQANPQYAASTDGTTHVGGGGAGATATGGVVVGGGRARPRSDISPYPYPSTVSVGHTGVSSSLSMHHIVGSGATVSLSPVPMALNQDGTSGGGSGAYGSGGANHSPPPTLPSAITSINSETGNPTTAKHKTPPRDEDGSSATNIGISFAPLPADPFAGNGRSITVANNNSNTASGSSTSNLHPYPLPGASGPLMASNSENLIVGEALGIASGPAVFDEQQHLNKKQQPRERKSASSNKKTVVTAAAGGNDSSGPTTTGPATASYYLGLSNNSNAGGGSNSSNNYDVSTANTTNTSTPSTTGLLRKQSNLTKPSSGVYSTINTIGAGAAGNAANNSGGSATNNTTTATTTAPNGTSPAGRNNLFFALSNQSGEGGGVPPSPEERALLRKNQSHGALLMGRSSMKSKLGSSSGGDGKLGGGGDNNDGNNTNFPSSSASKAKYGGYQSFTHGSRTIRSGANNGGGSGGGDATTLSRTSGGAPSGTSSKGGGGADNDAAYVTPIVGVGGLKSRSRASVITDNFFASSTTTTTTTTTDASPSPKRSSKARKEGDEEEASSPNAKEPKVGAQHQQRSSVIPARATSVPLDDHSNNKNTMYHQHNTTAPVLLEGIDADTLEDSVNDKNGMGFQSSAEPTPQNRSLNHQHPPPRLQGLQSSMLMGSSIGGGMSPTASLNGSPTQHQQGLRRLPSVGVPASSRPQTPNKAVGGGAVGPLAPLFGSGGGMGTTMGNATPRGRSPSLNNNPTATGTSMGTSSAIGIRITAMGNGGEPSTTATNHSGNVMAAAGGIGLSASSSPNNTISRPRATLLGNRLSNAGATAGSPTAHNPPNAGMVGVGITSGSMLFGSSSSASGGPMPFGGVGGAALGNSSPMNSTSGGAAPSPMRPRQLPKLASQP